MRLDVISKNGQPTGRSVELADDVFGIEPNDHAIYLAVKQYLANQRQGTHKAKERGEIRGSTKKIKRQKGTGTARAGSIKSPIFRGGGRMFGPRPRNYGIQLNKKVKALARNSALAYKAKDSKIVVVEDFNFDAPKTREYTAFLKNLGVEGQKTLLVVGDDKRNVYLSARNLPKSVVQISKSLGIYDIMHANTLILSESAVSNFAK